MDWSIIVMALPILAVGLLATLKVCHAAIAIGIVLGFALGYHALSRFRAVRIAVLAYVDFVRGTPLLVQIFLVYFALPVIGINFNEYWAGVTALSLNAGGFICEIVRSGMQSIDRGQVEAATSIGLAAGQLV